MNIYASLKSNCVFYQHALTLLYTIGFWKINFPTLHFRLFKKKEEKTAISSYDNYYHVEIEYEGAQGQSGCALEWIIPVAG